MDTLLGILYGSDRFLRMLLRVSLTVLQTRMSFTGFYSKLYGHGIQSFLLCVLSIALSVTSVPTTNSLVASSLYAVLLIVLTIVHFDGTSILSLHNMQCAFGRASLFEDSSSR
jgi:uncharacterized membrane protein